MTRVPVWLWRWNTLRQWWYLRAARRDRIRRCADTNHVPMTEYGYRNGVWGPLHHVCRRCGKELA